MDTYEKFKKDLFKFVMLVWIVVLLLDYFHVGWDSTDGDERSGLKLHIDNLTGCQYLSTSRGGITPRLDKNAKQICTNSEK